MTKPQLPRFTEPDHLRLVERPETDREQIKRARSEIVKIRNGLFFVAAVAGIALGVAIADYLNDFEVDRQPPPSLAPAPVARPLPFA